ncbi:MAG: 1-deoxy-D-xylulose-5-phosphate synthase [Ignavibacteria bacterium]|nr:MAG: 1-deoxy-D-xylulose-5-phosphate synthase [Ignavibacteria bacterium]
MSDPVEIPLLNTIDDPSDLRKLDVQDLRQVSSEIRDFLIDAIAKTGGHLGAGLGTVELAVALHYAFQTPEDKILWDVGHQAYPHKILTGRRDRFHTIRQYGGISGFLKRKESIYDVFGAGHATTSISAALGIAAARDFKGEDFKVVSVIGDGSMTGGMAYEAMNNCGLLKKNMIVVLNDNNMSISPNVWAISNYFNEFVASPTYNRFRANIWDLAGKFDHIGDRFRKIAARLEGGVKSVVTPGMLFEALGFRYFGPINGHNVVSLVKIFEEVRDWSGPILVHVITQKGKGYEPAEKDDMNLHGVTPFDKITGKSPKSGGGAPSYTDVFADALVDIVKSNEKVVGITAAMSTGTGLDKLQREVPEKYFDVGIAEQHAVTFAAGMATEGYIPVATIYSTFLQRAFDQVLHDVAIQNLHVVFAIDRGGLVGADGPTHHGAYDLSYLRLIPGMVIMAPSDEQELRDMLYTAVEMDGPVAVRYPRGKGKGLELRKGFESVPLGKGVIVREGEELAILAVGNMVPYAQKAAELLENSGRSAAVVNMRFVKPLDHELLDDIARRYRYVLTVEDNSIKGGFGSGVAEYFAEKNYNDITLRIHGLPDEYVDHGTQEELHRSLNLDPLGIARTAGSMLGIELTTAIEKDA